VEPLEEAAPPPTPGSAGRGAAAAQLPWQCVPLAAGPKRVEDGGDTRPRRRGGVQRDRLQVEPSNGRRLLGYYSLPAAPAFHDPAVLCRGARVRSSPEGLAKLRQNLGCKRLRWWQ